LGGGGWAIGSESPIGIIPELVKLFRLQTVALIEDIPASERERHQTQLPLAAFKLRLSLLSHLIGGDELDQNTLGMFLELVVLGVELGDDLLEIGEASTPIAGSRGTCWISGQPSIVCRSTTPP
jgi:hypothetical protein